MVELGELEKTHEALERLGTRLVAVSVDEKEDAKETQARFPHLAIVSDSDSKLIKLFDTINPGAGPEGKDIAAPMTVLVDSQGVVRWIYRSDHVFTRLPPSDLLAAVEKYLP